MSVFSRTPDILHPFDRRLAVAAHHLSELDDGLAGVRLHRHAAHIGRLLALLEKFLRAGIHLHGSDHALEPAAVVGLGLVDDAQRLVETGAGKVGSLRAVCEPAIKDVVAVVRVPFAGAHHRARRIRECRS